MLVEKMENSQGWCVGAATSRSRKVECAPYIAANPQDPDAALGFRGQGLRFRVLGLGSRVQCLRVQGLG